MRQDSKPRVALAAMAAAFLFADVSAQAMPMAPAGRWIEPTVELAPSQIRAGGRRGGGAVAGGHRGGGAHGWHGGAIAGGGRYHGGAYRGGVYHGGRYYGGGAVVRPGYGAAWVRPYAWAPGAAIATGAALGFVTAATAAAWASAPPQPGLCWYYTDASKRNGFWDACPR